MGFWTTWPSSWYGYHAHTSVNPLSLRSDWINGNWVIGVRIPLDDSTRWAFRSCDVLIIMQSSCPRLHLYQVWEIWNGRQTFPNGLKQTLYACQRCTLGSVEWCLYRRLHTIYNWLVVWTPLKNICQLGWLFPIYGKIKTVPNHQPDKHGSNLRFKNAIFPRAHSLQHGSEKGAFSFGWSITHQNS